MEFWRTRWGFDNCLSVDYLGRVGGLALLWMNDIHMKIKFFSKNHIDATVLGANGDCSWKVTEIYGKSETSFKHNSWRLLRHLGDLFNLPWLCFGDFNELTSSNGKLGGATRPKGQMAAFRQVIDEDYLLEVSVQGSMLTWRRGLHEEAVFELSDKGLGIENWFNLFPYSVEKHLVHNDSDHCHNRSEIWNLQISTRKKGIKVEKHVILLGTSTVIEELDKCKADLDELLLQKEILWKQRLKTLWLNEVIVIQRFSIGLQPVIEETT
ncbi:hypothetical protein PTKIN_Ptkin16aG0086800 [Pterospermum kingtungense]